MNIQIMKIYEFMLESYAVLVFILGVIGVFGGNSYEVSTREKRAVVFPLGGTFKLVIGVGTPIKLSKTRTITIGWNFQWQYPLAVNTTAIKTYPPILSRKTRDDTDLRRREIYEAIENFLIGRGDSLKDCLVRYICEEAYSSFKHTSDGPYGELLHVILSQDVEDELDLNQVYKDARSAGKFGVDCFDLYPNCNEDMLMRGLFSLDFT